MKNDNLVVILPAASFGQRILMSPKCLISLDNQESLLNRHLRLINDNFPSTTEVFITIGHRKEKVKKHTKDYGQKINFVENNDFENTNVAHSIGLALKKVSTEKDVLVIYGDLCYSKEFLKEIPIESGSCLLIDRSEDQLFKKDEVGLLSNNECNILGMNYALNTKWSQTVYCQQAHRKLFDLHFTDEVNHRMFGFEVINKIMSNGVTFKGINSSGCVEIDSYKDLLKANAFVREE